MSTVSAPPRSGNPGIVPPWLRGGLPPAPAPGSPDGPAVPVTPPTSSAPAADAASGARERSLGSRSAARGVDQARLQEYVRREQQRAEDAVADVRRFFDRLGVRAGEGNGAAAAVEFLADFPNAAYLPIGPDGREVDHIHIGRDPRSGRSFAQARDVVAHEWAHRVVDRLARQPLELSGEDAAVHESLADTFAAAYDADDWQIGEDIGTPIRTMDRPELLGHPGHVKELDRVLAPGSKFIHPIELEDGSVARTRDGRVVMVPDWHVVAGIPNKAASIIGDELGRDAMARIYVKAVRDHVRPGQEIEGLASAVLRSTEELYGAGSRELAVAREAWDQVGVLDLLEGGSTPSTGA